MKKTALKFLLATVLLALIINLFGCAALKKKFTRKSKVKRKTPVYYTVKKYDVKPSIELYEKHYIFWFNWDKKLIVELGKNFKSDIRSTQEMIANLQSMASLLVDEKAAALSAHVDKLKKVESILKKRNLTKANETRIRHILEREYRSIKRKFSPAKMKGYIRNEWK